MAKRREKITQGGASLATFSIIITTPGERLVEDMADGSGEAKSGFFCLYIWKPSKTIQNPDFACIWKPSILMIHVIDI